MWKFKTGGISPEEFGDCENSMEFFKNIRDGEIDLKKKWSLDQFQVKQCITQYQNIFEFYDNYSLMLPETKHKTKHGK